MKKLISIIAALSMIASLSVTSFAAIDVDVSDAATGTTLSYSEGSFTASITGNTSQDTIVVVKGDGNDISTTSIEYINQDTASQNFNFVLKNTPDAEEDFAETADNKLTYTVLMGGDTVSKTEVGTITYTYTADKFTVAFVDATGTTIQTNDLEVGATITAPATNPTKDDVTKEDGKTYTYTFIGWAETADATEVVDFTDLKVTKAVTYYPIFTEAEKEVGGEENEYTPGDVFVDGSVDDNDYYLIQLYYEEAFDRIDAEFGEAGQFWNDEGLFNAADVFVDGSVDDNDYYLIQLYYEEAFDRIDAEFGEAGIFWE